MGDLCERRALISGTLVVTAAGLGLAAATPGLVVFAVATIAVVGVTSVVVQIIVPMSSLVSAEHERGTVVSGLLIGIPVARTESGLIAAGPLSLHDSSALVTVST